MRNESEKLLKIRRIAIENVGSIRNWVRDFPLWLCRGLESNFLAISFSLWKVDASTKIMQGDRD